MSAYGPNTVFSGSIASGASTLTSVDLSSRSWRTVYVQMPTMSTAAALDVYGSIDNSTFGPLFTPVQTFTTLWVYQSHVLGSAVGANGGFAPIYPGPCQYLQFRASAVVSGGVVMKVICSD